MEMQIAVRGLLVFIGLLFVWIMFEILSAFNPSLWWGLAAIALMLALAFSKKIKTSMDLTNIVGVSMILGFLAGVLWYHPILSAVDSFTIHIRLPSEIYVVPAGALVLVLIFSYKKIKALMEYSALPFFIMFFAVVAMLGGMAIRGMWNWLSQFV